VMVLTAVAAASPAIASTSAVPHRQPQPGVDAVPGRGLTLARAPAGLRAAVGRTLGLPAAAADGAFQQAKLTAADGALGDELGYSVAVAGSTAVVGAPDKNSGAGAVYVFTSSGGTWSQRAELTATGGSANSNFGWSVALSGSVAVVGAPGKSAAYVFTGSGGTWSQRAELTAAGGVYSYLFGFSVALSGSTAVVGAYGQNSYTGAAYVFTGSGGTWTQRAELTAADGAPGEAFGISVAVSRSTAVVGAYGKNSYTGAAYVFTGSGGTWSQRAELTAADGAAGDGFGYAVALSGSTAVVGAPYKSAAYVFTGSGGTWTQQAKLTAADAAAGDQFGGSVAVSASTAVVGAPAKNSNTGAAYVFALPTQQAKLAATGGAANSYFGYSVAISGSTAVVGAYGKNSVTGAAYVFTLSRGSWSQRAELTAAGGTANDYFGWSVAIYGSTVVIGAPGKNSLTGAAYVFTGSGSTWTQQAKLTAADAAAGDHFGYSVALSGSTAVVGAPGKNTGTGAVYVFTGSGSSWPQQAELTASDPATTAYFGWSVALSGSAAVVGAPGNYNYTGTAYVFTGSGSSWPQQAEFTGSGSAQGGKFGISVAITGTTAVVGAPLNNGGAGAAYLFTGSASSWPQQAELTAADAATGDHFGNSVTLSGSTAVVGAPGKNSTTGAAYVFGGV